MAIFNKSNAKKTKPKQGHKLVWFSLVVIAIPCLIVAIVLLQSMGAQNNPVSGNRFSKNDLNPSISKAEMNTVRDAVASNVSDIENITINLKSATLRINVNADDSVNEEDVAKMVDAIYDQVNAVLPIDEYFTNREDSKMYDLEINVYNWLVDDNHPDGQIYIQCTKTGAGEKVVDNLTSPKDVDLVNSITRTGEKVEVKEEKEPVQAVDEWGNPVFDENGNPVYETEDEEVTE